MPHPSTLSREALEAKYRSTRRWAIMLAAVAAFLALVVAGQYALSPASNAPGGCAAGEADGAADAAGDGASADGYEDSPVVRRDPDDPAAYGDVDAPVVLTLWTDLRCPFCAAFQRDTLPTVLSEYVESGKVRLEVVDVVFFGDESEDAAVAATAAGAQGKYAEFVEAVYDAAPESGHPDMPREKLIGFAEKAGIADMERFSADLDDQQLHDEVMAATSQAQQMGVNAVPYFRSGNVVLSGAHPADTFREYLDQMLASAE